MKKVAIRVKDKEHGARVINYFKSIGGVNDYGYEGCCVGDMFGIKDGFINAVYIDDLGTTHTLMTLEEAKNVPTKTFPREMLCWDGREINAVVDLVLGIFPDRNNDYKVITSENIWKNAKELPEKEEPKEMTLAEVCEALGKDIKIIK